MLPSPETPTQNGAWNAPGGTSTREGAERPPDVVRRTTVCVAAGAPVESSTVTYPVIVPACAELAGSVTCSEAGPSGLAETCALSESSLPPTMADMEALPADLASISKTPWLEDGPTRTLGGTPAERGLSEESSTSRKSSGGSSSTTMPR